VHGNIATVGGPLKQCKPTFDQPIDIFELGVRKFLLQYSSKFHKTGMTSVIPSVRQDNTVL
jgi:hypothetical protein